MRQVDILGGAFWNRLGGGIGFCFVGCILDGFFLIHALCSEDNLETENLAILSRAIVSQVGRWCKIEKREKRNFYAGN